MRNEQLNITVKINTEAMEITDIIKKHTWIDSDYTDKEKLKKELLDLFGVSGSLELLQKERDTLNKSRNAMTPDWKCSQMNRHLHTIWIAEELIKPLETRHHQQVEHGVIS